MTITSIHESPNYYSKYPFTICFLTTSDNSEILLLNRQKKPWMGCWNGIGGKLEIEKDPTPLEGILREIVEEAGVPKNDLLSIKSCGIMEWFKLYQYDNGIRKEIAKEKVDYEKVQGMYIFHGTISNEVKDKYLQTPKLFDEGILDWKRKDWVLNENNLGVVKNIKLSLPNILNGEANELSVFKAYFTDINEVEKVVFVKDGYKV